VCPGHETLTQYFSCSGGTSTDHTKSALDHVMSNFCVLHAAGCAVHVLHSGASGRETSTHYFSCLGGTGTDLTKSASRHIMLNYFASSGICG
jgi:hypothetical protein